MNKKKIIIALIVICILSAIATSLVFHKGYADDEKTEVEKLLNFGEILMIGNDYKTAIIAYEKALLAIKDTYQRNKIHYALSTCYLHVGIEPYILNKDDTYFKKAVDYAEKVLETDPENWHAIVNKCTAYMDMDNFEKAASCFQEAKAMAIDLLETDDSEYVKLEMMEEMLLNKMRKSH